MAFKKSAVDFKMCIEDLKVVVLIVNAGIYFVRGLNCDVPPPPQLASSGSAAWPLC